MLKIDKFIEISKLASVNAKVGWTLSNW